MKRRRLLALLLSVSCMLSACSGNAALDPVGQGAEQTNQENASSDSSETPAYPYDTSQWEKGIADICRNEDGYYAAISDFIYYIDSERNVRALCNKADCSHDDAECNAYLLKTQPGSIWYNGNKIYAVATSHKGGYGLYQIEPDGSGMKELSKLFQAGSGASVSTYYDDDAMYCRCEILSAADMQRGTFSDKLYRVELKEGAKPELLYENPDGSKNVDTGVGVVCFLDDDAYVPILQFPRDGSGWESKLYRYDKTEDKMEVFLEDSPANMCIQGEWMYYQWGNTFCRSRVDGNEKTVLFEDEKLASSRIYFDGTYFYLSDSGYWEERPANYTLSILKEDGTVVDQISFDSRWSFLCGDGEELVWELIDTNPEGVGFLTTYYFYDKDQIGTGKADMESVEIADVDVPWVR